MPCQLVVERVTLCWVGFVLTVVYFIWEEATPAFVKERAWQCRESQKGATSGELLYVLFALRLDATGF